MISELAADLKAKVQSVAALTDSSSFTLGGKAQDPGLLKVGTPAAWLKFSKESSDEQSYEHGPASGFIPESQLMLAHFLVTILVPYNDDDDLLDTEYPLLKEVQAAVHAQESPSGFRWRYAEQRIALVYTDRLAYEQRYTVNYSLSFSS